MISRKFAYADDSALLHSFENWKDLEETCLQLLEVELSHTKTVTAAFYLNNREAKRELKVYNSDKLLPFSRTSTWGKTGQIAHVSSPSIAQKTILACHTAEATRGLGMECWC